MSRLLKRRFCYGCTNHRNHYISCNVCTYYFRQNRTTYRNIMLCMRHTYCRIWYMLKKYTCCNGNAECKNQISGIIQVQLQKQPQALTGQLYFLLPA